VRLAWAWLRAHRVVALVLVASALVLAVVVGSLWPRVAAVFALAGLAGTAGAARRRIEVEPDPAAPVREAAEKTAGEIVESKARDAVADAKVVTRARRRADEAAAAAKNEPASAPPPRSRYLQRRGRR